MSSPELFREESSIADCIKQAKLLQGGYRRDEVSYEDCQSTLAMIDDRLRYLLGDNLCFVASDHLYTPIIDEQSGQAITHQVSDTMGHFDSLLIGNFTPENGHESQTQIVARFAIQRLSSESLFVKNKSTLLAVSTIDNLEVIPMEEPELILPPEDDPIAFEINQCLLDEEMNLASLAELVNNEFGQLSDMEVEYYMNYINSISKFSQVELITSRAGSLNDINNIYFFETPNNTVRGNFKDFRIFKPYREDEPDSIDANNVHVGITIEAGNRTTMVLLEDIESIHLH